MENVIYTIPLEEFMDKFKKIVREEVALKKEQEPADERLVNTAYVVKVFNRTAKTIKNWRDSGVLPFYRIKRNVYFKESEILAVLNQSPLKRSKAGIL